MGRRAHDLLYQSLHASADASAANAVPASERFMRHEACRRFPTPKEKRCVFFVVLLRGILSSLVLL